MRLSILKSYIITRETVAVRRRTDGGHGTQKLGLSTLQVQKYIIIKEEYHTYNINFKRHIDTFPAHKNTHYGHQYR